MKKTTCKAMAGACEHEITGETAEEMIKKCQTHAMEAVAGGDEAHKQAMDEMMNMSKEDQEKFGKDFTKNFDSLPDA